MIRLGFKPEFQGAILDGTKTGTLRRNPVRGLHDGVLVAAVSGIDGKPDWLTPADKRFATLRITVDAGVLWKDVDDSLLARTTVDRAWYEARYPDLHEYTRLQFYGFEVVK